MAEFQMIVDGKLVSYDEEISLWNTRLQELMEKERARSN